MALELRQQLKLTQQLVMTPQLQQAIKLLQLSRLELMDTIRQEIEQNPVLEESAGSEAETEAAPAAGDADILEKTAEVQFDQSLVSEIDWKDYANEYEPGSYQKTTETSDLPSRLNIIAKKPDLQSHLNWQMSFAKMTEEEKKVGKFIIGNLDQNGLLKVTTEDIVQAMDCNEDQAERVIAKVQEMDPAGIGARDVKESLLLQLDRLGLADSLAADIIGSHLKNLETKRYDLIARATKHSLNDVHAAVRVILNLDPHPGRLYSDEEPQYIIPDVYVYKIDDEYVILLNDEGLPRLRINSYYKEILKNQQSAPDGTKEYIQDKIKAAVWLIKSIQQRQRTIYKVVESLLKFQRDFFEKGVAYLKPLILRDVAEDIKMHESTISRVTNNKYIHSPQGIFELKYFFNSAIEKMGGDSLSSESIKAMMLNIIESEDPEKPLSDNEIAEIFKAKDIKLARRTVAKYRELIGKLPSKLRRRPNLEKLNGLNI